MDGNVGQGQRRKRGFTGNISYAEQNNDQLDRYIDELQQIERLDEVVVNARKRNRNPEMVGVFDEPVCPRCGGTGMIFRIPVTITTGEGTDAYRQYTLGGEDACPACSKLSEVEYLRYKFFESVKK